MKEPIPVVRVNSRQFTSELQALPEEVDVLSVEGHDAFLWRGRLVVCSEKCRNGRRVER